MLHDESLNPMEWFLTPCVNGARITDGSPCIITSCDVLGESADVAWGQMVRKGTHKSKVSFWVSRPRVFSALCLSFASALCHVSSLDQ